MHSRRPNFRWASAKRWVTFFGWGSLAGLLLPALLMVVFAVDALQGKSEQNKLRDAREMAWVEKDWTRALQLYRELLADHPGGLAVADGHLGMARALEGMGISGEEVAVAYEAATRLSLRDEGRGDALMKAAQHRLADGQEAQAAELFRQVIAENRDAVAPAHLALGRLLLAQGSVDEALEHFQILSTSADPQVGALGRFGISISYERLGDLDSAIAELDEEEASVSSERLERLSERRSALSR